MDRDTEKQPLFIVVYGIIVAIIVLLIVTDTLDSLLGLA